MTAYTTDSPLDVRVRFGAGTLTVQTCTDGQVSATVEAQDPDDRAARVVADQARIGLDGHRLTVDVPGKGFRRTSVAVHVRLTIPELSCLTSQTGDVLLEATGELGEVKVRTGNGEVRLPSVRGAVDVRAGHATVTVGTAASVSMASGKGQLHVDAAGDVSLKTGHGQAQLQSTWGQVVVKGGGVSLDLREARSGRVQFETGAGNARVGVAKGTTVELDLTSGIGQVRCDLPREASAPPGGAALMLRLRTGNGDLVVGPALISEATT